MNSYKKNFIITYNIVHLLPLQKKLITKKKRHINIPYTTSH